MSYIFTISVGDIQHLAVERIGRRLTSDELRHVKKGIQYGLESWESVAEIAIDEVTGQ